MKQTFTTSFLKENSGCYKETEGKLKETFLANGKTCFEEAETCHVTLEEILSSNIPTEDKYWFLSNVVLSLEERKELFLLVMNAVSEATADITIKEYIASLIQYAAQEVDYDTLYASYKKTTRVGWVVFRYNCYLSHSYLGFSRYKIYWLLTWMDKDSETRELVWNVINKYVKE